MARPVQLGPTTWKLRTDAPPDPVTGRRRQMARVFHGSLTAAKLAQAAFEVEHKTTDHTGTAVTCSELFRRWLANCEDTLSEQTVYSYRHTVRLYLTPHLGAIPVRDITPSHLDDFYRHLVKVGRNGRPLHPSTVRRIHQVARAAFAQAERWDWITRNPARNAQPPATPRRKPNTPDPAAVQDLLDRMREHDHPTYLFLEVTASLGCRPGELCALRWRNVDWSAGTVEIESSVTRMRNVKTTKTNRERTVAVDDFTLALLKDHRPADCDPEWFVFGGATPWTPNRMTVKIRERCAVWGIPAVTPRALRHYVATRLISNGVDVRTVAGRLGHASATTTLAVYASFVPENDRDAADLLRALRSTSRRSDPATPDTSASTDSSAPV